MRIAKRHAHAIGLPSSVPLDGEDIFFPQFPPTITTLFRTFDTFVRVSHIGSR
jgi:hypothetical protein